MQLVASCYLTVTPGYLVFTFGYLTAKNDYFYFMLICVTFGSSC